MGERLAPGASDTAAIGCRDVCRRDLRSHRPASHDGAPAPRPRRRAPRTTCSPPRLYSYPTAPTIPTAMYGCGRTCVRILQTLGACKTVPPKRDSVHASLRTARPVPRGPALLAAPPTSPPSEACRRGACLALWRPSRACSCKARAATALSFFFRGRRGKLISISWSQQRKAGPGSGPRSAFKTHTCRGPWGPRGPSPLVGHRLQCVRREDTNATRGDTNDARGPRSFQKHTCDLHLESAHNFIYDLSLGHELKLQSGVCKRQFVDRTARQTGN